MARTPEVAHFAPPPPEGFHSSSLMLTYFGIRHRCTYLLKGTHARDFYSLFLNFFLHLSVTNRYKTQFSQHFKKYTSKFAQLFKIFDHSPFFSKA
jgi:hypothetical protein